MIIFKSLLFSIAFFTANNLFAQITFTGRVLNMYTRLPVDQVGIAIYKGTSTASTNSFGYFQLIVQKGDSLLITHPDYKPGVIPVPETTGMALLIDPYDDYHVYKEGIPKLYEYLQMNLNYPRVARLKKIEGVMFIELSLDANGHMTACRWFNDIGGNCAKHALAIFRAIPGDWYPSSEAKRLLFPVVYSLGHSAGALEIPDLQMPNSKVMDEIVVYCTGN